MRPGQPVAGAGPRGHQATGLDSSAALLADLGESLRAEPQEVQDRVRLVRGHALRAAELSEPEGFDAVLCHGVLMYLPDPGLVPAAIAAITVPGGLVWYRLAGKRVAPGAPGRSTWTVGNPSRGGATAVTEPAQPGDSGQPGHPGLRAADILARGGWHPSYVRVLAAASDGDCGFALIDGNGDGAELEAEAWLWDSGQWVPGTSSGAGPLDYVGSLQTGGEIGPARFAYGRAPGRRVVTVSFEHRQYDVPVSQDGVWVFVKVATDPASRGAPTLAG